MNKVLITGISGFLGSHIAEKLIAEDIKVIGLKRKNSDLWRCRDFEDKITWVDIDDEGLYEKELLSMDFDTVIHGAWIGVEADSRDNWVEQSKNVPFLVTLLEVSKKIGVQKFIFLGSQAEYGNFNGKITEESKVEAFNAYGSVKLACLEIVKTFCATNGINWIWLRLFSLFGEKENTNWLIPSLVKSMLTDKQKDFTFGEQKYAYLYVKDYAEIMNRIVVLPVNSGVYNVSSIEIRTIKSLIEDVRNYINPNFILNFGALNYRRSQSMHMQGDITKLIEQIGDVEYTNFDVALQKTLNYYLK